MRAIRIRIAAATVPMARLASGRVRSGAAATRTASASAAATKPPLESVIHSASITTGIAAIEAERTQRALAAPADQVRSTIAAAIADASPFQ